MKRENALSTRPGFLIRILTIVATIIILFPSLASSYNFTFFGGRLGRPGVETGANLDFMYSWDRGSFGGTITWYLDRDQLTQGQCDNACLATLEARVQPELDKWALWLDVSFTKAATPGAADVLIHFNTQTTLFSFPVWNAAAYILETSGNILQRAEIVINPIWGRTQQNMDAFAFGILHEWGHILGLGDLYRWDHGSTCGTFEGEDFVDHGLGEQIPPSGLGKSDNVMETFGLTLDNDDIYGAAWLWGALASQSIVTGKLQTREVGCNANRATNHHGPNTWHYRGTAVGFPTAVVTLFATGVTSARDVGPGDWTPVIFQDRVEFTGTTGNSNFEFEIDSPASETYINGEHLGAVTTNFTATPSTAGRQIFPFPKIFGPQASLPPDNDNFVDRIPTSGPSGQVTGTNVGATKEAGEPNHAGNVGGKSVWWKWTAPLSGLVALDTHGSNFGTLLAVYAGSNIGSLTELVSNDDDGSSNNNSGVVFSAQPGIEYQIVVDGFNGVSGDIALNWVLSPPSNIYDITASAGANGSISPSGVVPVNQGANQTFTMTPAANYHVADVLVDGVSVGAVRTYSFTNVLAPHTISVTFAINTYDITASAGANGSISPSGVVPVNHGANQTFTMTPAANYHVADVLVDGVSVGAVTTYTFTNVLAAHTISVTFAINTYTITTSAGANGNITPSGAVPVNHGANQTYTITPDANYHTLDVLVDGVSVGAVTTYTFTNVTAPHTISVTFFAINQAPSVNAGPNQTVALPANASLNGTVTDDGLPNPPAAVTSTWTKFSGPGVVTFGNASAVDTTASFSQSGIYVLRLTANDGALSVSDDVQITVAAPPIISQSPSSFSFTGQEGGANPVSQTLSIQNSGGEALNWSVGDNATWLSVSPSNGISTGEADSVTVSVNTAGLLPASYNATITVTAPGATNTPQSIPVTLTVTTDDSDNDGLPDNYELAHGLNPNDPLDALFDSDGDSYTNLEEFLGGTDPRDATSLPIRPFVVETSPHDGQGLVTGTQRVPIDSSIAIRIQDQDDGIDPNTIVMTVEGIGVQNRIRTKAVNGAGVTDIWVIYDTTNADTDSDGKPDSYEFAFGQEINARIEVSDTKGIPMNPYAFSFKVETQEAHEQALAAMPTVTTSSDPVTGMTPIEAAQGTPIAGAKILFNPAEPVRPRYGPDNENPPVTVANGVGLPLNLEPPTVFDNPVTLFIPAPGVSDLSLLKIYVFTPERGWQLASGVAGWMVPGSRINHPETSPPTIEIQVNHFTGVQAAEPPSAPPSAPELVFPDNGETGLAPDKLTFGWNQSVDPNGDTITYGLIICEDSTFTGCSPTIVAKVSEKSTGYAALGLVGLIFGIVMIGGGNKGRRKIGLFMVGMMITASLVVSCSDGGGGGGTPPQADPPTAQMTRTISDLKSGTSYHWKVRADDGKGGISESEIRSFTTAF